MTIRILRFERGRDFLDAAESWLLEDEVVNNLILGKVLAEERQTHGRRRQRPVYTLVVDNGQPVLAAFWSVPDRMLLSTHVLVSDAAIEQLVDQLALLKGNLRVVFGPVEVAQRFAALWAAIKKLRVSTGMEQRLYVLQSVADLDGIPSGSLHSASLWNRELMGKWVYDFHSEALPSDEADPETAQFIADRLTMNESLHILLAAPDGFEEQPVSMAAKARPTQSGIAVNLVYTPPAFRKRGYATTVVSLLSRRLLDEGWKFCTLYTDLSNPTSNHIYEKIGYLPVTDFTEFHFLAGT